MTEATPPIGVTVPNHSLAFALTIQQHLLDKDGSVDVFLSAPRNLKVVEIKRGTKVVSVEVVDRGFVRVTVWPAGGKPKYFAPGYAVSATVRLLT